MNQSHFKVISAFLFVLFFTALCTETWAGPRGYFGSRSRGFSGGGHSFQNGSGLSISGHRTNQLGNFYKGPHGTAGGFNPRGFRGLRGGGSFVPQSFNGNGNIPTGFTSGPGLPETPGNGGGRTVFNLPNHFDSTAPSPGIPVTVPRNFGGVRGGRGHHNRLIPINPRSGILRNSTGSGIIIQIR